MSKIKVLFAGESWFYTTTETKGFDQFTIGGYQTEIDRIIRYLGPDFEITHLPAHLVLEQFPSTMEQLSQYDVVMISDVGANTFYLHPQTFNNTRRTPNRLALLREYVKEGGALGMFGGYMSFQGIEGKGKWAGSEIEECLPVNFSYYDDRAEHPEGICLQIDQNAHPILQGFPTQSPPLLGYNVATAKPEAQVLIQYQGDPMLCLMEYGKGRTFTWSSDCAPHWMPEEFCNWEYNSLLWQRVVRWAANK